MKQLWNIFVSEENVINIYKFALCAASIISVLNSNITPGFVRLGISEGHPTYPGLDSIQLQNQIAFELKEV